MKTQKKFTTISLVLLTLAACERKIEENKTSNPTNNSSTASVIFKLDGSEIKSDSAHVVLYTLGILPHNRVLDMFAFKSGKKVLEFHFLPKTGTQTVKESLGDGAWLTYKENDGASFPTDYYNGKSGNFNLSVCDTVAKKVQGTFDFSGNNGSTSKAITNGTINITDLRVQ